MFEKALKTLETLVSKNRLFAGQMMTINAKMPLSETVGVAKRIRELSSGLCSIHMEFSEYQKVLPAEQAEVMRKHFSQ